MDLEYGCHLSTGAVVGGDVKRLSHATRRTGIGDIADNRPSSRSVGTGEDVRLRTNYSNVGAEDHTPDINSHRKDARPKAFRYYKADRIRRYCVEPTGGAANLDRNPVKFNRQGWRPFALGRVVIANRSSCWRRTNGELGQGQLARRQSGRNRRATGAHA